MTTIQPSIETQAGTLADWFDEAIALVQRVNARLRQKSSPGSGALSPERQVLTDDRCLVLAGLIDDTGA